MDNIPSLTIELEQGPLFIFLERAEDISTKLLEQFPKEFPRKDIVPKGLRINCDLYIATQSNLYSIRLDVDASKEGTQTLYELPLCTIYNQIYKILHRNWSRFWQENEIMLGTLKDYLRHYEPILEDPFLCEQCKLAKTTHIENFRRRQGELGKRIREATQTHTPSH